VAPPSALSLVQGIRYPSRRHPLTLQRCGVKTTRHIADAGVFQGGFLGLCGGEISPKVAFENPIP
jgi:hypothetical protein